MKLFVKDVISEPFTQALNELLECPNFPSLVSYELSKAVKELQEIQENFNKAKNDLFTKLGEKSEDGKTASIPKDKIEEFQKALEPLLNKEEEVKHAPVQIKKEELPQLKPMTLFHTSLILKID